MQKVHVLHNSVLHLLQNLMPHVCRMRSNRGVEEGTHLWLLHSRNRKEPAQLVRNHSSSAIRRSLNTLLQLAPDPPTRAGSGGRKSKRLASADLSAKGSTLTLALHFAEVTSEGQGRSRASRPGFCLLCCQSLPPPTYKNSGRASGQAQKPKAKQHHSHCSNPQGNGTQPGKQGRGQQAV